MERKVVGKVSKIKQGVGVRIKEGGVEWFIPEKSLKAAGITEIKIGDKISFEVERGLCGFYQFKVQKF